MLVIVILLQVLSHTAIENSGLKMPIHELIEVPLSKWIKTRFKVLLGGKKDISIVNIQWQRFKLVAIARPCDAFTGINEKQSIMHGALD